MALLAISYPSLAEADRAWVQEIRRQHDILYYDVVAPHFTLVFPTSNCERQRFGEHVRGCVQGHVPIAFLLRCALVVKDVLSDYTHTFLVPDQGFGDIVKLHDKLYTGLLADQLRLDIPFIPHITVATALDPAVCKHVADQINSELESRNTGITGSIRMIDIVQYADRTVTTLEQIPLG